MRELFVDVEGWEVGDVFLHFEVCGREGGRGGRGRVCRGGGLWFGVVVVFVVGVAAVGYLSERACFGGGGCASMAVRRLLL